MLIFLSSTFRKRWRSGRRLSSQHAERHQPVDAARVLQGRLRERPQAVQGTPGE